VEAGWGQTLIAHALLNAACAGLHVCQLDICEHLLPRAILLMHCVAFTKRHQNCVVLHCIDSPGALSSYSVVCNVYLQDGMAYQIAAL